MLQEVVARSGGEDSSLLCACPFLRRPGTVFQLSSVSGVLETGSNPTSSDVHDYKDTSLPTQCCGVPGYSEGPSCEVGVLTAGPEPRSLCPYSGLSVQAGPARPRGQSILHTLHRSQKHPQGHKVLRQSGYCKSLEVISQDPGQGQSLF